MTNWKGCFVRADGSRGYIIYPSNRVKLAQGGNDICIRKGIYKNNIVCIIKDRYSILLDMNTCYAGDNYYANGDNYYINGDHLYYDDGLYDKIYR